MTLERRKPLERKTRLRANVETARAWERRSRKPLAAVGAKAKRERAAVDEFRAAIRARARGRCEATTPACPEGEHDGHHAHHVWPSDRDAGRHDPNRGRLLCAAAHAWVHANPADAEALGLLGRSGS